MYYILLAQSSIILSFIGIVLATAKGGCSIPGTATHDCIIYPGCMAYGIQKNWGIMIVVAMVMIGILIFVRFADRKVTRSSPTNYILLGILTLSEVYVCAYISV